MKKYQKLRATPRRGWCSTEKRDKKKAEWSKVNKTHTSRLSGSSRENPYGKGSPSFIKIVGSCV